MINYYSIKKPVGSDKNWEARFMIWCKTLKINYVRRSKKEGVSFDISCNREDYEALLHLIKQHEG